MSAKKIFIKNLHTYLQSNDTSNLKSWLTNHSYYQLNDEEYYLVCLGFHKVNDYITSNQLILAKSKNINDFKLKRKFTRLEIFNLYFLQRNNELKKKISIAQNLSYDAEIIRIYYLICKNIDDYQKFILDCKKNILANRPTTEESLLLINFLKNHLEYELLAILLLRILKFDKNNQFILEEIAKNYFFLKKYILSKKYYKKILLKKTNDIYLLNIAIISNYLRHDHDFNNYLVECLKKNSENLEAIELQVNIAKTNKEIEYLISDLCKKEKLLNPSHKSEFLFFSLSKLYEKKKDYFNSYNYFTKANAIKDKRQNFDINKVIHESDLFLNYFGKKQNHSLDLQNKRKKVPIFIVGLPRSGTTLVDHIFGAHKMVKNFGETSFFLKNFKFFFDVYNLDRNQKIFQQYNSSDYLNYGKLYLSYFKLMKEKTYFTDKMPFNFFYLGLIKYTLPESKIVICKRNYLDVGLSILKNNFANEMSFAFNKKNIIEFIKNYHRTINQWKSILGDQAFEIDYEQLVQQPKNNVISLLKFCDLPFDSDCLDFYKKKLPSDTVSVHQVNKSFYDSSIGAWKNFYNYLPDFFDSLSDIK